MSWLTGWTYRKSVTLRRQSGAVTDYQMKLLVGESVGASGEEVDCGGKCRSDFADLRFTTQDGETLLDYWIESITGTTPNQLATVWVKFDSIGTSPTMFYMYYGKTVASSLSDGENTFIFFDDFDVDLSKWTGDAKANASIADSIITVEGDDGWKSMYGSIAAGSADCAARFNLKKISAKTGWWGFYNGGTGHWGVLFYDGTRYIQSKDGAVNSTVISDYTLDAYKIFDLIIRGGTNTRLFENGVECNNSPKTTNPPDDASMKFFFSVFSSPANILCDWVFIRKYSYPEPTWGSWGHEEAIGYQYLFGDADIVLGGSKYLFGDADIVLGGSKYLFGDADIVLGGSKYLCVTPTIVSRLPKPIYGRHYQRISSVKKEVT